MLTVARGTACALHTWCSPQGDAQQKKTTHNWRSPRGDTQVHHHSGICFSGKTLTPWKGSLVCENVSPTVPGSYTNPGISTLNTLILELLYHTPIKMYREILATTLIRVICKSPLVWGLLHPLTTNIALLALCSPPRHGSLTC